MLLIHIHNVEVSVIGIFLAFPECIMGTAVRSESIAGFRKLRLVDWCQNLRYCLLNHPIYHCRYSQLANLSPFFLGYLCFL